MKEILKNQLSNCEKRKRDLKDLEKLDSTTAHISVKLTELRLKCFYLEEVKEEHGISCISTNTKLSFNQMVEIYNIRWSIEIFFKEAKQLLGLGGTQSTNFDVQVVQTTITMIQYLIISLKFRTQAYETIGGVFREMKQDFIELKLNDRIMAAVIQALTILDELGVTFDIELVISKLMTYDKTKEDNQIYSNFAPL